MSDQAQSHDGVEPQNHDGAEHPYKRYIARLEDIKLLSDVVCQLDCQKNQQPAESEAVRNLTVLVNRAHDTLIRMLGDDAGLVYAAEDEEQAA